MAFNTTPKFPGGPRTGVATPAASTAVQLIVAGTSGSKLLQVFCHNANPGHTVTLYLRKSGVNYVIAYASGIANIATGILNITYMPNCPKDKDGNPYLMLEPGDEIWCMNTYANSSFTAFVEDF